MYMTTKNSSFAISLKRKVISLRITVGIFFPAGIGRDELDNKQYKNSYIYMFRLNSSHLNSSASIEKKVSPNDTENLPVVRHQFQV